MQATGSAASSWGLENHGLVNSGPVHWNPDVPALYEHGLRRGEGVLARGGGFVTETGEYTGRSPRDKFIVDEPSSSGDIWWGPVNNRISEAHFETARARMTAYLQKRELFVQDVFAGADPDYRLPVRVVTEQAWHSLFARNMFIPPDDAQRAAFRPEFTVLHAPNLHSVPEIDGTRSEVGVLLNFAKRLILVTGSHYTGEIKKTIFSVLNYILPGKGVLSMHCSSNVGPNGDTAIFFGLSGTGKTTLSADPTRTLIGDDEHGWSDNGVFNFEGGCYAKTIALSAEAEPEIHTACFRFGTLLENVVIDPVTREPDFDDGSLTENTRASYPLHFLGNVEESGMGGHPANIVMLTADAFGVLPPISRLSPEQAMYHFLSGYTARLAGTERGLGSEPEATFSTCFGAPFLPRHPTVYARLLRREDRAPRRDLLAGQHRLERRRVRRRRADEDRPYPRHGAGGDRGQARLRRGRARPQFRRAGARERARRAERGAEPAQRLVRQGRLRHHRPRPRATLRGQFRAVRERGGRQGEGRGDQGGGLGITGVRSGGSCIRRRP